MSITELRYGKEDGYKVSFIDTLPPDNIVIALHSGTAKAYIVMKANNYESNVKGIHLIPISKFKTSNKHWETTTEAELLKDTEFKVYSLTSLADFGKMDDAWCYN